MNRSMSFIGPAILACGWASGGDGGESAGGVASAGGSIRRDTAWAGVVLVTDTVAVEPGVTLTVRPGARVKFHHYRGYREPQKRLSLIVRGRILADGTPDRPIYFTSDAPLPRNGDWSMVRLVTPAGPSRFSCCVFEFAQQGLNVWQGNDVVISRCVFRWNNWEGVYFESKSSASLEHCLIHENGYNGLACEQFNRITMDSCEVWRNGTNGVHVDASTLEIRRSLVHDNLANGLSVDDNGVLRARGVDIRKNRDWGIGVGQGANTVEASSCGIAENGAGAIQGPSIRAALDLFPPESIDIGYAPDLSPRLGYIPGDPLLDRYMYVYPDDETRRVVRKIGRGLGLTWSVAWDGESIWTATLGGTVYELDPITGAVLRRFPAPGPQPWGMTFDGQDLWIVDFAEKRISRVDRDTGAELGRFPTPDPIGGCKGVAWDGTYLNVMGWTAPVIYRMDRQGNSIARIALDRGGCGGIAWDGSHFWVPSGRILKYDTKGHAVGWIYPASEGTWDMTWDGRYLWATQRTNENWQDAKIYALEILRVEAP